MLRSMEQTVIRPCQSLKLTWLIKSRGSVKAARDGSHRGAGPRRCPCQTPDTCPLTTASVDLLSLTKGGRPYMSIFMRTFFLSEWSRHLIRLPRRQPLYPFHPAVSYRYTCASPTLWLRHGVTWQRPASQPNGHQGMHRPPWSDAWLP